MGDELLPQLFLFFLFAPVDNSPARFLARFLYKLYLRAVNGGRRKKRYLAISIYIYLDHSRPFWLFSHFSCTNDNVDVDVDDDGNDNVCSPMFTNDYPPVLASQSELCRNTTMTMMAKKNYFSDTDE